MRRVAAGLMGAAGLVLVVGSVWLASAQAFPSASSLGVSTRIVDGPGAQSLYAAWRFWGTPPCASWTQPRAYWTPNAALHGQPGRADGVGCRLWLNSGTHYPGTYLGRVQACKDIFHLWGHWMGYGDDREYRSIMNPVAVLSAGSGIGECAVFVPSSAAPAVTRWLGRPYSPNLVWPPR